MIEPFTRRTILIGDRPGCGQPREDSLYVLIITERLVIPYDLKEIAGRDYQITLLVQLRTNVAFTTPDQLDDWLDPALKNPAPRTLQLTAGVGVS